MIHSARPIVTPVVNIFSVLFFVDLKSGDVRVRTYGRTTCAKTIIPTCRDFGLAECIKNGMYNSGIFVPIRKTEQRYKNFFRALQIMRL